jgi:hypothetical protein
MADSSGHGVTGLYNAPNVTQGVAGPLVSDPATGISDNGYQTGMAAGPGGVPLYNSARSVEAWFRTTSTSSNIEELVSWGQPGNDEAFSLAETPNSISALGYNDDRSFVTPYPLNDGQWHQIVATYDGSTVTVYLDGVELGNGHFPSTLDTLPGSPLELGQFVTGGAALYETDLADVAVYPSALSAARVAAHFAASGYARPGAVSSPSAVAGKNQATVSWKAPAGADPAVTGYLVTALSGGTTPANALAVPATATTAKLTGLVGATAYKFNIQALNNYGAGTATETTAVTPTGTPTTYASTVLADKPSVFYRLADSTTVAMADSSGHGVTGLYNAPNVTQGVAGPLVSDPATGISDNGYEIGHSYATLPIDNRPRTVQAWVNTTNSGAQYIAGWGTQSNDEGFDIAVDGSHVYVQGYNDDLVFPTSVTLDDGNWHFVAVTSNGSSATAFVDGTSLGTQSFATELDTLGSANGLIVGAAIWQANGMVGDLADLAVFPTALSAAQIDSLYGEGRAAVPFRTRHLHAHAVPPQTAARRGGLS